jgi:hypothetical protein
MDPISYHIALNLSYEDLINLCKVNKGFYHICNNNHFWYAKYVKDFGKPTNIPVKSWKAYYRQQYKKEKLHYYMYINTLEPELNQDITSYMKKFI